MPDEFTIVPRAPEQEPTRTYLKEDTLFLFDWDDTLMFSTWLKSKGPVTIATEEHVEMGERLYPYVYSLLSEAMNLGRVVIVTNGAEGWIEQSCELFMPRLLPLIGLVTLVSARYRHWRTHSSPIVWKKLAFCEIYDLAFVGRKGSYNILGIGDSIAEEIAVHALSEARPNGDVIKSVKLVENPSPTQLMEQLEVLTTALTSLSRRQAILNLRMCAVKKREGEVSLAESSYGSRTQVAPVL